MKNKAIIYLCDSDFKLDSRPQKEVLGLLKNGYEVNVLTWNRTKNGRIGTEKYNINNYGVNLHYIYVKGKNGGSVKEMFFAILCFEWKLICWLLANIRKCCLVYSCNLNTALFSFLISKIFRKKFIYDIFDYYVDCHTFTKEGTLIRKVIEYLDHQIINNADAVILCSEKRIEQIKGSKPKKIEIIHNSPQVQGLDNTDFSNKYLFSNEKVKIAYIGYLEPGRPILLLADIVAENENLELHCAGYGPEAEVIEEISNRADNIFFYGQVDYNETLFIEKNCDIIPALYNPILKNHRYAAPNKFYEALLFGKPTLMIRGTGMDELVEKYELGKVCECSRDSMKEALYGLIRDKKKWKEMGMRGRQLYEKEYQWKVMEKRLIYVVKNVLA